VLWGQPATLLTSYTIECSQTRDPRLFTAEDSKYFYRNLPDPLTGPPSWGEAKLHFQRFGNLSASATAGSAGSGRYGGSFAPSDLPIIRCFWHDDWSANPGDDRLWPSRVNNVTLGFNVKYNIPYWELEVNPQLK
jgi:hypothetical protein